MWKSFSDGYMQIIYDCLVDLYYIPVVHPSKIIIKTHIDYFLNIPCNTKLHQLCRLYTIRQIEQLKCFLEIHEDRKYLGLPESLATVLRPKHI